MALPNNAEVLVIDGRKMLMFRNHGDASRIDLQTERHDERDDKMDREIKTDAAGSAGNPGGGSNSSMGETDFHQQAEDRFAHDAADLLKQRTLAGDHHPLAIIAAPKTLGELRKKLHKEVEKRVVMTLAKDMTGHTTADIEAALMAEGKSSD